MGGARGRAALTSDGKRAAIVVVIAAALFSALRIALIYSRTPDIDEIFTAWIATKNFAAMMQTLVRDSGPPLFYLIVRALHLGTPLAIRWLAFACGAATLAVVIAYVKPPLERATAAALLAVYPQHVFFSAEARTYALCALGVAVTAFALERWADTSNRQALALACLAILATAYSHYYGVLLLPLPFAIAALLRRPLLRDATIATVLSAAAYVPGFLLARRQGGSSVAWMEVPDASSRLTLVLGSFRRIGFDARHAFANGAVTVTVSLVAIATLLYALWLTRAIRRAQLFLIVIVVPIFAAIGVALIGFTAYFPIRFESVLSAAVVTWVAACAAAAPVVPRRALIGAVLLVGAVTSVDIVRAPRMQPSPEHAVAKIVRERLDARTPIVASHLAYLEVFGMRDAKWQPRLIGFPSDYEIHPGSRPTAADVLRDVPRLATLPRPFLWVGEWSSIERRVLQDSFEMRVVAADRGEVAAFVTAKKR